MNENIITEAVKEAFETVYIKNFIKEELIKAINEITAKNDRWITLKPHGDDADDYKRLLIKDGEDIEDAMHRQGYYNKRQAKDEKNNISSYNQNAIKYIKEKLDLEEEFYKKSVYYNRNRNKLSAEERTKLLAERENIQKKYLEISEEENKYIKDNSGSYPENSKIAGVKRESPMTFEKANNNNVNPKFSRDSYEYSHNCQCAVIAYEARRRGYNVEVVARNKENITEQLATHTSWAYIDKETGNLCEAKKIYSRSSLNLYKKLENEIKPNERYQFSFSWYRGATEHGHIITIERNAKNEIQIYDPQTSNVVSGKEEVTQYLKLHISYKQPTELLRVDNKDFNKYFINDVVKKK